MGRYDEDRRSYRDEYDRRAAGAPRRRDEYDRFEPPRRRSSYDDYPPGGPRDDVGGQSGYPYGPPRREEALRAPAHGDVGGQGRRERFAMPLDGFVADQFPDQTSFTGKGPKGYQPAVNNIRDQVCERLMRHPEIDASDIEVTVDGGEVTLTGGVDSRRTKRLAEDVAEEAPGVTDVHNRLRIVRTGL